MSKLGKNQKLNLFKKKVMKRVWSLTDKDLVEGMNKGEKSKHPILQRNPSTESPVTHLQVEGGRTIIHPNEAEDEGKEVPPNVGIIVTHPKKEGENQVIRLSTEEGKEITVIHQKVVADRGSRVIPLISEGGQESTVILQIEEDQTAALLRNQDIEIVVPLTEQGGRRGTHRLPEIAPKDRDKVNLLDEP